MLFSLNGIETADFFEFREWTNLNFPLHCHYSLEVVFTVSGNVKIKKGKETFSLSQNDALVIMPLEKHSFSTDTNSQVFIFQISPKLISNWDLCFGGKVLKNPCRKFSKDLIKEIQDSLKTAEGNVIEINYIFFKIMREFLNENELIKDLRADDICISALIYISENFSKNITLKSMADDLNVSSVYLSKVFSNKIKFKFVDCLNSFRIQKATSLLLNSNKSIGEICFECGFGSIRQFNRVFLDMMSVTPKEYRKRMNN